MAATGMPQTRARAFWALASASALGCCLLLIWLWAEDGNDDDSRRMPAANDEERGSAVSAALADGPPRAREVVAVVPGAPAASAAERPASPPFVVDCVDEHGRPVPAARVHPRQVDGEVLAWGSTDGAVVSGADGRALLTVPGGRRIRASAIKADLVGDSDWFGRNEPTRIVMKSAAAVEIRVMDVGGSVCAQPCLAELRHVENPRIGAMDSAGNGLIQVGLPCDGAFNGEIYTGLEVLAIPQFVVTRGQLAQVVVTRQGGRGIRLRVIGSDGGDPRSVLVEPDAREPRLRRHAMATDRGVIELPGVLRDVGLLLSNETGGIAALTIDGQGRPSCTEWDGDLAIVRLERPAMFEFVGSEAYPEGSRLTLTCWQTVADGTVTQRQVVELGDCARHGDRPRVRGLSGTYYAWATGGEGATLQSFTGVAKSGETAIVDLASRLRPVRIVCRGDGGALLPGLSVDIRASGVGRVAGRIVRLDRLAATSLATTDSQGEIVLQVDDTSLMSVAPIDGRFWPRREQVSVRGQSVVTVSFRPVVEIRGRVVIAGSPCVAQVALRLAGDAADVDYGVRRTALDGSFTITGPKGHATKVWIKSGGRSKELAVALDGAAVELGDIELEPK